MSTIESNSNLHYVTGKYLGLLNDYLVALKDQSGTFEPKKLKELQDLFEKLGDDESIEPHIQMLNVVIENELRKNNLSSSNFFNSISQALDKKTYAVLSKQLQYVVSALDDEYSHSLAKIKGK